MRFFSFIFLTLLSCVSLFGSIALDSSQTCKGCHPVIYQEYQNSPHAKSSIFTDSVHKAIWDKHPAKKKERYKCAKCHTPSDTKLLQALKNNESALPQDNSIQNTEPISCAYCHQIKDVALHAKSNTNIMTSKEKTLYSAREGQKNDANLQYEVKTKWFGLLTQKSGSPFHDIDFTNDNFYNGKVCIGCHSHKQNSLHFDICNMDVAKHQNEKENCISCHMPKIKGTFTTAQDSKTHRFHGFIGVSNQPAMLAKYVKITFKRDKDGFEIAIKNEASHQLLLHPLRVGELQVSIQRGTKEIQLKPYKFLRIIGKDGKPSMPWLADEVLKDNHIKAKEKRIIRFQTPLQSGDVVEVKLGHYKVNPKIAKKLGLNEDKSLTTFKLFKKERFEVVE